MFLEDHGYYKINDEHLSLFTQNSVAYVAGFVIKSLRRLSRTCKQCVQCLIESDADSIGEGITSLLHMKDCGGLIKPSNSCYKICMAAEKAHKMFVREFGDSLNVPPPRFMLMTTVMDSLLPKSKTLFPTIQPHLMESEFSVDNHFVSLVKEVANTYISLKLHLQTATLTRKSITNPIRHKYTKLIQFKNQ